MHVSVGVLINAGATIIRLHGNPAVSTAPVGFAAMSPTHTLTHRDTHIHTAGMEKAVGRGLRSTNRWYWPRFGDLSLTGGMGDSLIPLECPHGMNDTTV